MAIQMGYRLVTAQTGQCILEVEEGKRVTLSQQQKALVENVIMVVEEVIGKWSYHERRSQRLNYILVDSFECIKIILKHERPRDMATFATGTSSVAEVIGKEVRRARSYKDMAAKEIIEALDTALEILKRND